MIRGGTDNGHHAAQRHIETLQVFWRKLFLGVLDPVGASIFSPNVVNASNRKKNQKKKQAKINNPHPKKN